MSRPNSVSLRMPGHFFQKMDSTTFSKGILHRKDGLRYSTTIKLELHFKHLFNFRGNIAEYLIQLFLAIPTKIFCLAASTFSKKTSSFFTHKNFQCFMGVLKVKKVSIFKDVDILNLSYQMNSWRKLHLADLNQEWPRIQT